MSLETTRAIEVFYSYAHEDERFVKKLVNHLGLLKQEHYITDWYNREIGAGAEWATEIEAHLNSARIILLLVSPNFMASNYCYGIEMKRALERHEAGETRVIIVILRPFDWRGAPFGKLQVLPKDAKPVSNWRNRDEAYKDIAIGIRKEVDVFLKIDEGRLYDKAKQYDKALIAYQQAIQLNHDYSPAYFYIGNVLYNLQRYHEALAAYEQVIRINPHRADVREKMGEAFYALKRYEEALAAYAQAIQLDSKSAKAYYNKGRSLKRLKKPEEAEQAYEKARELGYRGN